MSFSVKTLLVIGKAAEKPIDRWQSEKLLIYDEMVFADSISLPKIPNKVGIVLSRVYATFFKVEEYSILSIS